MDNIIFVDCETTGLDYRNAFLWELAVIDGNSEYVYRFEPSKWHLDHHADPKALEVNRYHERVYAENRGWDWTATWLADWPEELRHELQTRFFGKIICASNPKFDWGFIEEMFAAKGIIFSPYYHPIDIQSVMVGALNWREKPSTAAMSRRLGVEPPTNSHEALEDARWVKQMWKACQEHSLNNTKICSH